MDNQPDNLNMFQKKLDKDNSIKHTFISKEVDSSESDSDSVEIIMPKIKRKKNSDTNNELLFQLLHQSQLLSKTQKKMYKLQCEIDKDEISTRYIKLDLNNAQVKIEDLKDRFSVCKKTLSNVKFENTVLRCILVAYISYSVLSIFN